MKAFSILQWKKKKKKRATSKTCYCDKIKRPNRQLMIQTCINIGLDEIRQLLLNKLDRIVPGFRVG